MSAIVVNESGPTRRQIIGAQLDRNMPAVPTVQNFTEERSDQILAKIAGCSACLAGAVFGNRLSAIAVLAGSDG